MIMNLIFAGADHVARHHCWAALRERPLTSSCTTG